jgi:hypothetical protein
MDTEAAAQQILDQRGYLVVSSSENLPIGEVIENVDWSLVHGAKDRRPHKLVVIAETNESDHIEQARLAGIERWRNPDERQRYYRVLAE